MKHCVYGSWLPERFVDEEPVGSFAWFTLVAPFEEDDEADEQLPIPFNDAQIVIFSLVGEFDHDPSQEELDALAPPPPGDLSVAIDEMGAGE